MKGLWVATPCIPFEICQPLHQWHPPSPKKGITAHLVDDDASVIANPTGWGDL